MLFNSFEFLIFFPIVFTIYWVLNKDLTKQNLLLLLSSYIFYAWWDWRFLSLIIISSFIDFRAGIKIFASKTKRERKKWLIVSLVANLGFLSIFKYYNFFAESFSDLMNRFGWQPNDLTLNIILPVGISFYTFQTLSYSIDIYRKQFKPTYNVVSFFTYVSFFPQLVAGPIERASNLLPQIEKKRIFKKEWFNAGVIQILIGLFRKIVIADNIAGYVDTIYADVSLYNSSTILLATVLYAFQIYFDFAGYSDIAIGTAKLLGFKFNQNFNLPYFSKSLTEFWRKWHISLSFWLRDYLYISLGGNRKGIKITYRNLMLTMLLGGLWHGANWTFLFWGGIHGVVLSLEKFLKSIRFSNKFKTVDFLGYPLTFGIVIFSWIFFRSQDLNSAFVAIKKIFQFNFSAPFIGDINLITNSILVLSIGLIFDLYLFNKNLSLENLGAKFSLLKIVIVSCIVIMLINLFYSSSNNFIYFQF
ncbi:MBOAT family O-acyltransferase [Algibacter pectinivorans]|uniref:D-alanyl-lipoteichoic acid acyltransferase DltB, MBOAT superfamily n=1 Tax=Algibacter pectinivorans TaxID=870482 RepID=A0A1I1PCY7_9FLAO|nr:MBOAT family O-acyltransferase [Algibacter pectinivorans]SFD07576.1 D-alanyl-lipoteichoic acid acyltransferase DltB, MBOAT superfamily [Algibacter pectinivorans]